MTTTFTKEHDVPNTIPVITAAPARRPVLALHQHEYGRRLVLTLFERQQHAGPPFTLADEHGELALTASQLEQLVSETGPVALRRYRQQERALLNGGLDDEPPAAVRARKLRDDAPGRAATGRRMTARR